MRLAGNECKMASASGIRVESLPREQATIIGVVLRLSRTMGRASGEREVSAYLNPVIRNASRI
jgi:hypothetical protein